MDIEIVKRSECQEVLYKKYRDDSSCFPLIEQCIKNLVIIDKSIFDKNKWDYDYYIWEMFHEITPYCWCGTEESWKIDKYLYFLNKWLSEEERKYINEQTEDLMNLWTKISNDKKLCDLMAKEAQIVYDNELLYSFLDKEGLFEHWTSVGSCWLTEKGKFYKKFLEIYKEYKWHY